MERDVHRCRWGTFHVQSWKPCFQSASADSHQHFNVALPFQECSGPKGSQSPKRPQKGSSGGSTENFPNLGVLNRGSWERLNGGSDIGGLAYLSSIVHNCLQLSSRYDKNSFYKRVQKAINVHNCRRLCTSCREWP